VQLERQKTRQLEQELRHLGLKRKLHQQEHVRRTKGKKDDPICIGDDLDGTHINKPGLINPKKPELIDLDDTQIDKPGLLI
jgi:hypothetical protein